MSFDTQITGTIGGEPSVNGADTSRRFSCVLVPVAEAVVEQLSQADVRSLRDPDMSSINR